MEDDLTRKIILKASQISNGRQPPWKNQLLGCVSHFIFHIVCTALYAMILLPVESSSFKALTVSDIISWPRLNYDT